MKKALVEKKYLATFVLITSLFFMWGFAHAILDVLNKHFQEVLEMTKTRSALVQVMLYTGYFTMAIPAGLFISRRGYRAGVIVDFHGGIFNPFYGFQALCQCRFHFIQQ